MIYLVTASNNLFSPENYKIISVEEALEILEPLNLVAADTETEGLDPHTNNLLSVQLGDSENQIVIDCTTINIELFKDYLESDRTFIFWNAAFDLKFLYKYHIVPKNVYDGFLAEKLLYLGYEPGSHEYSLRAAGYNYLGIELDKSVRGKIIKVGLTEEVIVYAANDIKYEPDIMDKQLKELEKKDLLRAIEFENKFVPVLAYIEYCGVKLDVEKWKTKMKVDKQNMLDSEKKLNEFVINFYKEHSTSQNKITLKKTVQTIWYDKDSELYDNPKKIISLERIKREDGLGIDVVAEIELDFPYVFQDLQGDLFSGFNTDYQCNINWNSNKQVLEFFKLLGVNCKSFDPKEKKEKEAINEKVLASQVNTFPILKIYLDYKGFQKLSSTYGQNWLDAINPKTGRIHTSFHQLGTDTGRLSSGGGTYKLNLQNLPKDELTRSCFIAENGNAWISSDYKGQESVLMASISNDKTMIQLLTSGEDMHSYVAKLAWPEIIGDTPIEEIEFKFKNIRQAAKSVEFAIAYGGNAVTISKNNNIPMEEAQKVYDIYMNEFKGVAAYQKFRRQDFKNKGYILISPLTGHKVFFDNWDYIKSELNKRKTDEFWEEYRRAKEENDTYFLTEYRNFKKLIDSIEKKSINFVIQGHGALCFKLSSIKFFEYLRKHNLLFKVLYCVPVHDEINIECPKEMAEEMSDILLKCMEDGAAPFCTKLKLTADPVIGSHWIH